MSGITFYALKGNGPPWQDEQGSALPSEAEPTQYPIFPYAILDIERNGIFNFQCPYREFNLNNGDGDNCCPERWYYRMRGSYEVRGLSEDSQGTGAKVQVVGSGFSVSCRNWGDGRNDCFTTDQAPIGVQSLTPYTFGSGYSEEDKPFIRIFPFKTYDFEQNGMISCPGDDKDRCNFKSIVFQGYVGNQPANPNGVGCELKSIRINDGGEGYLVAPELKIISETGFGAYATCTVKDGTVSYTHLRAHET